MTPHVLCTGATTSLLQSEEGWFRATDRRLHLAGSKPTGKWEPLVEATIQNISLVDDVTMMPDDDRGGSPRLAGIDIHPAESSKFQKINCVDVLPPHYNCMNELSTDRSK